MSDTTNIGEPTPDTVVIEPGRYPSPHSATTPDRGTVPLSGFPSSPSASVGLPPPPHATWHAPSALAAKSKRIYEVTILDGIFALVTIIIGYLWWDWVWPHIGRSQLFLPGVGVTAFFTLALIISVVYYRFKAVHLDTRAIAGIIVILAAALPYAFFATTPLHLLLGPVLIGLFVVWHAYVSRTAAGAWPSAAWLIDFLNQGFVAPVHNLGAWWAGLTRGLRDRRRLTQVVVALVGLVVGLPLIILVTALLMSADAGFQSVIDAPLRSLRQLDVWSVVWRVILGLPLAVFAFNLLYANAHHSGVGAITPAWAARANRAVRKLPAVGLATPMVILVLIYVVFFAAMTSYLFSGFAGHLPSGQTYAEYARSGFFQLAAVATINLVVVGFGYLFAARRHPTGAPAEAAPRLAYPPFLRWLSFALSILTLLLIATAISKMALYIGAFGLTRLRLYTLVFMIALAVVFIVIGLRHLVYFRVGPPLVSFLLAAFLALTWLNTDRIIADHNITEYQAGRLTSLDIGYLAYDLSSATVPALVELSQGPDPDLASQAQAALAGLDWSNDQAAWPAWNLQDRRAFDLTHG